jgi:acetylornithine deacetylase
VTQSAITTDMARTLAVLERLVGFDTVSARPNAGIIAYIEGFLRDRGARITRLEQGDKAGLYAEIGPPGPGMMLSGHTDVVPVEGQAWTRAPFSLTRVGDRLYGRGTTDMKGYLACMLSAADMASRSPLAAPLKLVFSYDEEIGCVGIQQMIDRLAPLIGTPRAAFVGEPTEMQVAIGHKGKAAFTATCRGRAGHSSLAPDFVNALHLAADFVTALRDVQDALRRDGARDPGYDIPYSTVHIGMLCGGTALNIVPDRADLSFEYRHLAGDRPSDLTARIHAAAETVMGRYRQIWDGAGIEIDQVNAYPGLDIALESPVIATALALAETKRTTKMAFGTEAGVFAGLGIPTVVCGPGSMAGQGHKPDEYITLDQIAACDLMMARIVEDLCRG